MECGGQWTDCVGEGVCGEGLTVFGAAEGLDVECLFALAVGLHDRAGEFFGVGADDLFTQGFELFVEGLVEEYVKGLRAVRGFRGDVLRGRRRYTPDDGFRRGGGRVGNDDEVEELLRLLGDRHTDDLFLRNVSFGGSRGAWHSCSPMSCHATPTSTSPVAALTPLIPAS